MTTHFNKLQFIMVALALAILSVLMWVPFGFNVPLVFDPSFHLQMFDAGQRPFSLQNFLTNPVSSFLGYRPFAYLWIQLHYYLTPDSFVGWNVIHALSFWAKGFALYVLVKYLIPTPSAFAFMVAALCVVYPVDTAVFRVDMAGVNFHFALYLLAVRILIAFWKCPSIAKLIGMFFCLGISVGTYDSIYPLILFSPLIIVILEKRVTLLKLCGVSALWYLIPSIKLYPYIESLFAGNFVLNRAYAPVQSNFLYELMHTFKFVYSQHLYIGYKEGFCQVIATVRGDTPLSFLIVSIVAALITGLFAKTIFNRDNSIDLGSETRKYSLVIIIGLIALYLGYVAFIPSIYRYWEHHTFFLSTGGAALAVVAMIYVVSQYFAQLVGIKSFRVVLVSLLVGLGTIRQLDQHRIYFNYTNDTRQVIKEIVEQTHYIQNDTVIVVINNEESPLLNRLRRIIFAFYTTQSFPPVYFDMFFNYIIPATNGVTVKLCYDKSQCTFTKDGILVSQELIPYDKTILFQDSDKGLTLVENIPETMIYGENIKLYNPRTRFDLGRSLPHRFFTMLEPNAVMPVDTTFYKLREQGIYSIEGGPAIQVCCASPKCCL